MGHAVTLRRFSDGERAARLSQRAAEDINVDDNGQTILLRADRPATVSRDLNYLRGEENVTCGKV
jgi:hypothetical protein